MIAYKLADKNNCTWGPTKWGPNVTHKATGPLNQPLCSNGWIHWYRDPLLAVLHDPIQGHFGHEARLWEAEPGGEILHDGWLKSGSQELTTIKKISLPVVTYKQRIAYGILCVQEVYKEPFWVSWANNWLSGKDRSAPADAAAARAAYAADAARAAHTADAHAAAVHAAHAAAAHAAAYATAAHTVDARAHAAHAAAAHAARAARAAHAAHAAARDKADAANTGLHLSSIAIKAMNV